MPETKSTPALYNASEEDWALRLHLGAGGIYLDGYINIDIIGDLASERPDLVEQNRATIDDYYAGLGGNAGLAGANALNLPRARAPVVDRRENFISLPYGPGTVDKIVCIQSFEHLPLYDAFTALANWWTVLRPGGVIILSVPDMNGTLQWLKDDNPAIREFAVRHLRGSERNGHNMHRAWYNRLDIKWLFKRHGFDQIEEISDIHVYPAIVQRAIKVDHYVPDRRYQFPLPGYDEMCRTVLDVGPGEFPLSLATHCFDVSEKYREFRRVPADVGNVEAMPYPDKAFDFVYASHIVEHAQHPAQALAELQRVGRRGFVQVPSVMLDWLMQHGEAHRDADGRPARWMCLQVPNGIVFVERDDKLLSGFTDQDFGRWVYRITQYNIPLNEPERYLRDMFWRRQDVLNVSASWDETHAITCIEVHLNGEVVRR